VNAKADRTWFKIISGRGGGKMDKVLVMIMAGGVGERLQPLTRDRAKAVVPFGGKFKLIDFTLSNCFNSGLKRIYVLTQYQSESIHRHLQEGWNISSPGSHDFIHCVPAQQKTVPGRYRGTADAVRQNLNLLKKENIAEVMILSSDHVYKMDYLQMLAFHRRKKANATISAIRVKEQEAVGTLGVLEATSDNRLIGFEEKPDQPKTMTGVPGYSLASMGVYLFKTSFLMQILKNSGDDFGKNIIPSLAYKHTNTFVYDYAQENKIYGSKIEMQFRLPDKRTVNRILDSCYWKDVGTIDSYYEASMDLLSIVPRFKLDSDMWPIRTRQTSLPSGRCGFGGTITNSIVSDGCIVEGGTVVDSILSPGVIVENGAVVDRSIIFEGCVVEPGARIKQAIVDKACNIHACASLGYDREFDVERGFVYSNSGIVVVPEGTDVSDLTLAVY
jgi:glucose-1-phosphate adenylyltransferase